jgi:hypothetical protein
MVLTQRPYRSTLRKDLKHEINIKDVELKEPPEGWSKEAVDFVNRVIL